ncbi:MAG: hypothetical protein H0X66_16665 [Verrucomicrobia bacterium]|nr:hypothetical protein [Verrucomicrobiota bacterium]
MTQTKLNSAPRLTATAIILAALCTLSGQPTATPHKEPNRIVMKVSDLDRTWTMEGRLKLALGTVVTVDGTIIDGDTLRVKAFQGKTLLSVEKVQGKRLLEPIVFRFRYVQEPSEMPKFGSKIQFVGFESGEFAGVPNEGNEYLMIATQGFHFRPVFEVLKQKMLSR